MPMIIFCPLYVEGQYITVCTGLYQFTLFPRVGIKSSSFHSQKCFGLEEREHRGASWMPVDVTSCWSTNSCPLPPVPVLKPCFPASLEGVCPCDWILANECWQCLLGQFLSWHMKISYTQSFILLPFCLARMKKPHREMLRPLDYRAFLVSRASKSVPESSALDWESDTLSLY